MQIQRPTTDAENAHIHHNNASPNKTRAVIQYSDEQ